MAVTEHDAVQNKYARPAERWGTCFAPVKIAFWFRSAVRQHVHLFPRLLFLRRRWILLFHPIIFLALFPAAESERWERRRKWKGAAGVKCQANQISNVRPIRGGENKRREREWVQNEHRAPNFRLLFLLCSWLDGLSAATHPRLMPFSSQQD